MVDKISNTSRSLFEMPDASKSQILYNAWDTNQREFTLALLVALRYREMERCIRSLTVRSPFPQGTMTQTPSKQTVTFILYVLDPTLFFQQTSQHNNLTRIHSPNDRVLESQQFCYEDMNKLVILRLLLPT